MTTTVILGAQWGDEGKGKIVDMLTNTYDIVARFNGGNNAGHTIHAQNTKYVLHSIPSGILTPHARCLIGHGAVLNPITFCEEMDALTKQGVTITPERLGISYKTHVILPYHITLDTVREQSFAENKIGTTGKGIGPTYGDKVTRIGLRIGDFLNESYALQRIERSLREKNALFENVYNQEPFSAEQIYQHIKPAVDRILPFLTDVSLELTTAMEQNKKILFEGAQGACLDIDSSSYPYVTSSYTTTGSVAVGIGIPPSKITDILAVTKAYATRVGSGPFPTELDDTIGSYLQERGAEVGATTGRKRRCGWIDLVMLKEAVRVNGITNFAMTKLDVLTGLPNIRACIGYKIGGTTLNTPPSLVWQYDSVVPVYQEFPGWTENIQACRAYSDLPQNTRAFVEFIEQYTGVPITYVSVGAEREQTIQR